MTELELEQFLRERDYPEHVCRAGKSGLVARWRLFVEDVEKGYKRGIEDYRNELDIRGILAQASVSTPELKALDDRFSKQLTQPEVRVWESPVEDDFWNHGFPKNASGALKKDLEDEGLL